MCALMSVVVAKSDYIYYANNVFFNLREFEKDFSLEAKVINNVKCTLLRREELDDFYIDGVLVSISNIADGYELSFNNQTIDIIVYENQIIDMDVFKQF